MIEVSFEEKKDKRGLYETWSRRRRQRRKKCKLRHFQQFDTEFSVLELPVCYEEGKKMGKEWFMLCLQKIRKEYPKEMVYLLPDVCRAYDLPEYGKSWIAGYFFLAPFWNMVKKEYDIEEKEAEIVVCDTMDVRSGLLVERLALKGKRMEIVTTQPTRWEHICEKYYQENGLVIEVTEHTEQAFQNRIIFDLDGHFLKQYVEWEQENIILCPCLKEAQKAYLRNRVNKGRIVCGYVITMEEKTVDKTFAAIYMQSRNWRIRQMANTGEIRFQEQEIAAILKKHRWDVAELEQI